MSSQILPLVSSLNYLMSSRGKKHIYYQGFLYALKTKNFWRCPTAKCNGSLKTTGEFSDERVEATSETHTCSGCTQEELECKKTVKRMKDRVLAEPNQSPFLIYTEEIAILASEKKIKY